MWLHCVCRLHSPLACAVPVIRWALTRRTMSCGSVPAARPAAGTMARRAQRRTGNPGRRWSLQTSPTSGRRDLPAPGRDREVVRGGRVRMQRREMARCAMQGLLASARRQCVPGRERVHIVSPVRDFPIFNLDDRAKSIVVFHACREHRPLDFIFDDDDPAIVGFVSN
jgi:hypothetical protein